MKIVPLESAGFSQRVRAFKTENYDYPQWRSYNHDRKNARNSRKDLIGAGEKEEIEKVDPIGTGRVARSRLLDSWVMNEGTSTLYFSGFHWIFRGQVSNTAVDD